MRFRRMCINIQTYLNRFGWTVGVSVGGTKREVNLRVKWGLKETKITLWFR